MPEKTNRVHSILTKIGLKAIMNWKENEPFIFDRELFEEYTPWEYIHSPLRETDEVYGISETVLLHKESGLRVGYVVTENYFRDELTYKLKDIFIITKEGIRLDVIKMLPDRRYFITRIGRIPYDSLKKTSLGD